MGKTVATIAGGVGLGILIAFANAGAFPFWGSDDAHAQGKAQTVQSQAADSHQPAPANAPEPNEKLVALPSLAPLVKRVMPTVVNVAVVQEVKTSGFPGGPGGAMTTGRRRSGRSGRWRRSRAGPRRTRCAGRYTVRT